MLFNHSCPFNFMLSMLSRSCVNECVRLFANVWVLFYIFYMKYLADGLWHCINLASERVWSEPCTGETHVRETHVRYVHQALKRGESHKSSGIRRKDLEIFLILLVLRIKKFETEMISLAMFQQQFVIDWLFIPLYRASPLDTGSPLDTWSPLDTTSPLYTSSPYSTKTNNHLRIRNNTKKGKQNKGIEVG